MHSYLLTCTGTVHCYMHKGQDTIRMVTNYVYKHLAGAGYNMCKPPQISPTGSLPAKTCQWCQWV